MILYSKHFVLIYINNIFYVLQNIIFISKILILNKFKIKKIKIPKLIIIIKIISKILTESYFNCIKYENTAIMLFLAVCYIFIHENDIQCI